MLYLYLNNKNTHTNTCTHTNKYTHRDTCTHAQTNAHIVTHMQDHTHVGYAGTHTHTHFIKVEEKLVKQACGRRCGEQDNR